MPRQTAAVGDREKRDTVEINFAKARLFTKREIGNQMSGFVRGQPDDGTCQERSNALPF